MITAVLCLQDCAALPGSPKLKKQPLTDLIALVRSQNKALLELGSANFRSGLAPHHSRSSKDLLSHSPADGTESGPRWRPFEELKSYIGSGLSFPMDKAMVTAVSSAYHAVADTHKGIPKNWVTSFYNMGHACLITTPCASAHQAIALRPSTLTVHA